MAMALVAHLGRSGDWPGLRPCFLRDIPWDVTSCACCASCWTRAVIVSAMRRRRGASFQLLRAVRAGRLKPLLTQSLLLEYEDVLQRPEQRRVSGLNGTQVDRVIGALALAAEPVEVHPRRRPLLRDPADEMVLEAAINGRAAVLVTHNIRDFGVAGLRSGVRVLRPLELVRELGS